MKKVCISIAFAFILINLLPVHAFAADGTISASETRDISEFGNNSVINIDGSLAVELTNTTGTTYQNMRIVCGSGVTLTLHDVKIDNQFYTDSCPLVFSGSGNELILEGESTLKAGDNVPGVHVPSGVSLTISGDGKLYTTSRTNSAGIGGGDHQDCGTITIEGGEVHATGGDFGAGIGSGGYSGAGGVIIIKNGVVYATGGYNGAGVGGGIGSSGGTITIEGGEVQATGGDDSAGIGGGNGGVGGSITIKGGKVHALGDSEGAGIGGGALKAGGTISIEGGEVHAEGGYYGAGIGGGSLSIGTIVAASGGVIYAQRGAGAPLDIGHGLGGFSCSLTISGDAAVFLRTDSCVAPTTSHKHETITAVAGGQVYGVDANGWSPTFGVYMLPYKLTYDANGGTGTVPSMVIQHTGTTTTVADASGLSRPPYAFSGWNTDTGGGGTLYPEGSTFTFTADTTLYAQWPGITLSVSPSGGIYTGGRITVTPSIPGGTWSFDSSFLSCSGNEFTALKAGTTTLTYTAGSLSESITITILESLLPGTGQSFTAAYIFIALAAFACMVAVGYGIIRRKRSGIL